MEAVESGRFALTVRRAVIEQSYRAHVGHIGSALSIADLLEAVFRSSDSLGGYGDPDRDRFVLSKGHAALALYAALTVAGRISPETLASYCADGSELGVHPEPTIGGVDFGTGSLGQGLPMAVGAALGGRWQESGRRIFALISDAECNEGSTWEAAMFAAHHQLGNLTAILDLNGQQALGYTEEVIGIPDLAGAWRAIGWDVREVDGHDVEALLAVLAEAGEDERPTLLLARTTFGKGVSFMEGKIPWHYWPLSDDQYRQAMDELGADPVA